MIFIKYSPQRIVAVDINRAATRCSVRRKAGGHYGADPVLQPPARGPAPLLFTPHS